MANAGNGAPQSAHDEDDDIVQIVDDEVVFVDERPSAPPAGEGKGQGIAAEGGGVGSGAGASGARSDDMSASKKRPAAAQESGGDDEVEVVVVNGDAKKPKL